MKKLLMNMSKIEEIKKAMVALGYLTEHIELEDLDDIRSKVIYDGHFTIGIYDFNRHTFVD